MQDYYKHLEHKIDQLSRKLELIHGDLQGKVEKRKYLSADEVSQLTGLDKRTILNRSYLEPTDKRFIPSVKFGPRRKLFERKVIERMFML